jgi:hypothetical protein
MEDEALYCLSIYLVYRTKRYVFRLPSDKNPKQLRAFSIITHRGGTL